VSFQDIEHPPKCKTCLEVLEVAKKNLEEGGKRREIEGRNETPKSDFIGFVEKQTNCFQSKEILSPCEKLALACYTAEVCSILVCFYFAGAFFRRKKLFFFSV
jgi:hypothetical protein